MEVVVAGAAVVHQNPYLVLVVRTKKEVVLA